MKIKEHAVRNVNTIHIKLRMDGFLKVLGTSPAVEPIVNDYIKEISADKEKIRSFFIDLLVREQLMLATKCIPYLTLSDINSGVQYDALKMHGVCNYVAINPLLCMAYLGKSKSVKYLVDNGANIEHQSSNNTTAIMFAMQRGDIEMVKYLYECGAKMIAECIDPTTKGKTERSIFEFLPAAEKINEFITYLYERGRTTMTKN